jgi:formylmethanofuran dehydrogenase subunit E
VIDLGPKEECPSYGVVKCQDCGELGCDHDVWFLSKVCPDCTLKRAEIEPPKDEN